MFERLALRAERAAEQRKERAIQALAERLAGELPRGVAIEATPEGVRLSGRRLARRFALEPALRWLLAVSPSDFSEDRR